MNRVLKDHDPQDGKDGSSQMAKLGVLPARLDLQVFFVLCVLVMKVNIARVLLTIKSMAFHFHTTTFHWF
jgi:hypothetical protein